MNLCHYCDKPTHNDKYCSRSHAARANNKLFPKRSPYVGTCLFCGGPARLGAKLYCSPAHYAAYKDQQSLARWRSGDASHVTSKNHHLSSQGRRLYMNLVGWACEVCGWDKCHPLHGKSLVQIDHCDGDPRNNAIENLKALCPNDHALTSTYGALNSAVSRTKYGLPLLNRQYAREDRMQVYNQRNGPVTG